MHGSSYRSSFPDDILLVMHLRKQLRRFSKKFRLCRCGYCSLRVGQTMDGSLNLRLLLLVDDELVEFLLVLAEARHRHKLSVHGWWPRNIAGGMSYADRLFRLCIVSEETLRLSMMVPCNTERYKVSTYISLHIYRRADKQEGGRLRPVRPPRFGGGGQDSDSAGSTARTPGSVASLANSTHFPLTCVLKPVRPTHHILASSSRLPIIERAEDVGNSQLQQTVDRPCACTYPAFSDIFALFAFLHIHTRTTTATLTLTTCRLRRIVSPLWAATMTWLAPHR